MVSATTSLPIFTTCCWVGRCEVPLLIEDVVERQQHLALGKGDLAVLHQHGRVAHALARPGGDGTSVPQITEIDLPAVASRAISAAASPASFTKEGFSTKVARRVAADAQLREDHQVCATPLRFAYILQNSCCIPSKIRNRRIDLRQRNLHSFSVSENAMQKRPAPAGWPLLRLK